LLYLAASMAEVNAINWFEIPVSDFARAKAFYEAIFEIEMPTSVAGEFYWAYFPAGGGVSGALCFGEGYIPSGNGSILYLNANPELNIILERVIEHGGRILVPKAFIGEGHGHFALVLDSEGNRIALHSDN
jgi:uncharacterized protein